jgi:hypothetical protein
MKRIQVIDWKEYKARRELERNSYFKLIDPENNYYTTGKIKWRNYLKEGQSVVDYVDERIEKISCQENKYKDWNGVEHKQLIEEYRIDEKKITVARREDRTAYLVIKMEKIPYIFDSKGKLKEGTRIKAAKLSMNLKEYSEHMSKLRKEKIQSNIPITKRVQREQEKKDKITIKDFLINNNALWIYGENITIINRRALPKEYMEEVGLDPRPSRMMRWYRDKLISQINNRITDQLIEKLEEQGR